MCLETMAPIFIEETICGYNFSVIKWVQNDKGSTFLFCYYKIFFVLSVLSVAKHNDKIYKMKIWHHALKKWLERFDCNLYETNAKWKLIWKCRNKSNLFKWARYKIAKSWKEIIHIIFQLKK